MHITYMVPARICKLGSHKACELDVIAHLIWEELEWIVKREKLIKLQSIGCCGEA